MGKKLDWLHIELIVQLLQCDIHVSNRASVSGPEKGYVINP